MKPKFTEWTDEEKLLLATFSGQKAALAAQALDRTIDSVKYKAKQLGVRFSPDKVEEVNIFFNGDKCLMFMDKNQICGINT
jgi:ABC-type uncharacterized transport system ATPase component